MIKIIISIVLILACAGIAFFSVFGGFKDKSIIAEEVDVVLPEAGRDHKILWVSDLHIAVDSDEIAADKKGEAADRISWTKDSAAKWLKDWPEMINKSGADLVIFGGDMADFCSAANLQILKEGLDKITIPYIYIRADHDLLPTFLTEEAGQAAACLQDSVAPCSDMMNYEFDDFIVAVWNNSTSNMTAEGLEEMKRICSLGKPVILATHVPLAPENDTSLSEASRNLFGGRSLLWGYNDDLYWPEADTRAFLDLIYAEDSPVVQVLCGHLHFSWDGRLSSRANQHVFPAAFEGYYGIINISGK